MKFELSRSCRDVIAALLAFTTIFAVLVTAGVYSVDTRVAAAIAPLKEDVVTLRVKQEVFQTDVTRKLADLSIDLRWLVQQQASNNPR